MKNFREIMTCWCRVLTKSHRKELERLGVGGLLSLKDIAFDNDFFRVISNFWDPKLHCFRFEGALESDELVPLPEEFGAILGFPNTRLPVIPVMSEYYYQDFERFFNLKGDDLSEIVHGREVDLVKFASYFTDNWLPESYHVYKRRALVFCLFNLLLFANGPNCEIGNAALVSVVEQVESGRNPSAVIVGETMMGLDAIREDPCAPMRGSPIILQVWLMERLGFYHKPTGNYSASCISRRKKIFSRKKGYREWDTLLLARDYQLRWTVPWWRIIHGALPASCSFCRIPSLTHLTFYFPCLVLRQFGLEQVVPKGKIQRPSEPLLNTTVAKRFEEYWSNVDLQIFDRVNETPFLSREYREWMQRRIREGYEENVEKIPLVKSRLGSKKLPVKTRLGPKPTGIVFKTPILKKKTRAAGKGKGIAKPKKKPTLIWKPKETGESSTSRVDIRTSNGSLLVREEAQKDDEVGKGKTTDSEKDV